MSSDESSSDGAASRSALSQPAIPATHAAMDTAAIARGRQVTCKGKRPSERSPWSSRPRFRSALARSIIFSVPSSCRSRCHDDGRQVRAFEATKIGESGTDRGLGGRVRPCGE